MKNNILRGYKKKKDGFFRRDAQTWIEILKSNLGEVNGNLHEKITIKGLRQIAYGEV